MDRRDLADVGWLFFPLALFSQPAGQMGLCCAGWIDCRNPAWDRPMGVHHVSGESRPVPGDIRSFGGCADSADLALYRLDHHIGRR